MTTSLRALLVEDQEDDAFLLLRELRRGGYAVTHTCVQTADTLREALREPWEIVFSDWSMPDFDAIRALHVFREARVDVPFIIVSGTVEEEVASLALRSGAQDFIGKGRFARLLPAVERELREAALRREQRAMQAQLSISERMASVGVLAASVAHEINNPLAALVANLEEAKAVLASLNDAEAGVAALAGQLEDAIVAATRIRHVTKDLKLFSHVAADGSLTDVDVVDVMESSLRMAANEIRHRARVVRKLDKVPVVAAEASKLGQVFLNLLVNAAQAIPLGNAADNVIEVSTSVSGGQVAIGVRDTGSGIPAETMSRLFSPFFTTKPAGVGTGLGLSICQRIVRGFGGDIVVESAVGQGSRFCVLLPLASAAVAAQTRPPVGAELPAAAPAAPDYRGRVLVIDDEVLIARALHRLLQRTHDVTATSSVREALGRIRGGEQFDVILCDLMMPEATGMDAHRELAAIDPSLAERMVFMSGGTFTPEARAFLSSRRFAVEKPFIVDELRRQLDLALRLRPTSKTA